MFGGGVREEGRHNIGVKNISTQGWVSSIGISNTFNRVQQSFYPNIIL